MKLRYSPQARTDIKNVHEYIAIDLSSPSAAAKIVGEIIKKCSNSKDFPKLGMKLSDRTGRETDLRYIVLGRYIAIYRIEKSFISIIRMLDVRMDYMHIIFEKETEK